MKANAIPIKVIRECSSKRKLEATFKEYKIVSLETKIDLLTQAMGSPAISYTCGFPSDEIRYQVIMSSFINGNWRDNYEAIRSLSHNFRGKDKSNELR